MLHDRGGEDDVLPVIFHIPRASAAAPSTDELLTDDAPVSWDAFQGLSGQGDRVRPCGQALAGCHATVGSVYEKEQDFETDWGGMWPKEARRFVHAN